MRGVAASSRDDIQVACWSLADTDDVPDDPRIVVAEPYEMTDSAAYAQRLAVCDLLAMPFDPEGEMLATGTVFDAVGLPRWKEMPDARAVLMDFRQARKKAGIREGDFHSLRLCFLRNCARAGVPPDSAARMADWEETRILAEIYGESLSMQILPQPPASGPGETAE